MIVNFYYDDEAEGEDGLLQLCRTCARKREAVTFAARGHDQGECEDCRASNDPANSAELDRLFAEISGRA